MLSLSFADYSAICLTGWTAGVGGLTGTRHSSIRREMVGFSEPDDCSADEAAARLEDKPMQRSNKYFSCKCVLQGISCRCHNQK